MKRFLISYLLLTIGLTAGFSTKALAYNFGDFRSETLTTKAWEALKEGDLEAVLAYTNKCIEFYGGQAKKMQASLDGYAEGPNEKVFSY